MNELPSQAREHHAGDRRSVIGDGPWGRPLRKCAYIVLFDLPPVAAHVMPAPRLEVVAGDFFNDPLPICDAYILMNVVHDWDDEHAQAILAAVATAGRSSAATVLLLEALLPESPEPHRAKTLDVLMLAITGGRERTLPEYDRLLTQSGLELVRMAPTITAFSIVEARVR